MAKQIYPVTNYVSVDEPCLNLKEEDIVNPQGKRRRFRIFAVIRNDKIAEHWEDLGHSENFRGVQQIRILGGGRDPDTGRIWIEHTVGELLEIARDPRIRRKDVADRVGANINMR